MPLCFRRSLSSTNNENIPFKLHYNYQGFLPEQLESDLDDPGIFESARDHTKLSSGKGGIGGAELGVIPTVVKFRAQFRVQAFANVGVLDNTEIPVVDAGLFQAVALRVSLEVDCVRAVRSGWG